MESELARARSVSLAPLCITANFHMNIYTFRETAKSKCVYSSSFSKPASGTPIWKATYPDAQRPQKATLHFVLLSDVWVEPPSIPRVPSTGVRVRQF